MLVLGERPPKKGGLIGPCGELWEWSVERGVGVAGDCPENQAAFWTADVIPQKGIF